MCGGGLWGVAPGQVTGYTELMMCTAGAMVGVKSFPLEASKSCYFLGFSQVFATFPRFSYRLSMFFFLGFLGFA